MCSSYEDAPNFVKWTRCKYPKWEVFLGAPDRVNIACLGRSWYDRHPSLPKQSYIQAKQIKRNGPLRFQNLILRPGVIHTVQNICGCIVHLMKGLGLEFLIGAVFGAVSSIMYKGKPRVYIIL